MLWVVATSGFMWRQIQIAEMWRFEMSMKTATIDERLKHVVRSQQLHRDAHQRTPR